MASPSLFFTIIFFRGGYVGKPLGKKTAKEETVVLRLCKGWACKLYYFLNIYD